MNDFAESPEDVEEQLVEVEEVDPVYVKVTTVIEQTAPFELRPEAGYSLEELGIDADAAEQILAQLEGRDELIIEHVEYFKMTYPLLQNGQVSKEGAAAEALHIAEDEAEQPDTLQHKLTVSWEGTASGVERQVAMRAGGQEVSMPTAGIRIVGRQRALSCRSEALPELPGASGSGEEQSLVVRLPSEDGAAGTYEILQHSQQGWTSDGRRISGLLREPTLG